jgi:hypothetical protein
MSYIQRWCSTTICTCFVDKVFGYDISWACDKHDKAYETQHISKERADRELFYDVKLSLPKWGVVVASVMWVGVRIGGYKTSWNRLKK